MKLFAHAAAAALVGLAATAAQAGINLPANVTDAVRFDGGTTAFETTSDPLFNPNTNDVAFSGDVLLFGFGDLNNINNVTGSIPLTTDRGSVDSDTQLVWGLAAQLNLFESLGSPRINNDPNSKFKKFNLTFEVSGLQGRNAAQLVLMEKNLNAGAGFGSQNIVGKSTLVVPTDVGSVAADASSNTTTYLAFDLLNAFASIDVIFEKTAGSSTFNKRTVTLQSLKAEAFPIVGGDAASLYTGGIAVSLDNLGTIVTTVAAGSEVGNDEKWSQGNFALTVGRNIPEPASLSLMGLGALLIGYRGRRERQEA